MINSKGRNRGAVSVRWLLRGTALAGISGVFLLAGSRVAYQQTNIDSDTYRLVTTTSLPNGEVLPAVVAIVGTEPITSQTFARQVAFQRLANDTSHLGLSENGIRAAALNALIRIADLHNHAAVEGLVATDSELRTFILANARVRDTTTASDPHAAAIWQALYAGENLSGPAAFDADPRTTAFYRTLLDNQKYVNAHVPPTATGSERETFIQAAVGTVAVQLFISISSETKPSPSYPPPPPPSPGNAQRLPPPTPTPSSR